MDNLLRRSVSPIPTKTERMKVRAWTEDYAGTPIHFQVTYLKDSLHVWASPSTHHGALSTGIPGKLCAATVIVTNCRGGGGNVVKGMGERLARGLDRVVWVGGGGEEGEMARWIEKRIKDVVKGEESGMDTMNATRE